MNWLLGNALGSVRLEVGDQDADAARAVLHQHVNMRHHRPPKGGNLVRDGETELTPSRPGGKPRGRGSGRLRSSTDYPGARC